jgi:hypothetical protein
MSKFVHKTSRSRSVSYGEHHRYEHWLCDNQVYFLTARCRDRFDAFATREARDVFWDRFAHYAKESTFYPWVVSLLDNHYHALGYLKVGRNLPIFIQRLHGSVAKLVNDLLPVRLPAFWRDGAGREYFDGCIRDERQARRAYRYTLTQCRRHGICNNPAEYPDTRVYVEVDRAIARSHELNAFLQGVPYKRYLRRRAGFSTRASSAQL